LIIVRNFVDKFFICEECLIHFKINFIFKGNLIGNSTVVKRLVLALAADRVFDDPAQKDHFVGN